MSDPTSPQKWGGVESTLRWSVLLRKLLLDRGAAWEELACWMSLDDLGVVGCSAWADNLYFVARSASAARAMVAVAIRELAKHGAQLKPDKRFVLSSDVPTVAPEAVSLCFDPGAGKLDRQEVWDVNVLGTVLSRDPPHVVQAHLRRAEGAFWASSDFSRCRDTPFAEKAEV